MGIYTATWVVFENKILFASGATNTLIYTVTGSLVLDLTSYIPLEVKVLATIAQPYGSATTAKVDSTGKIVTIDAAATVAKVIMFGIRQ
jgi:hypothetical protein